MGDGDGAITEHGDGVPDMDLDLPAIGEIRQRLDEEDEALARQLQPAEERAGE